jgi:hypothetical protein
LGLELQFRAEFGTWMDRLGLALELGLIKTINLIGERAMEGE